MPSRAQLQAATEVNLQVESRAQDAEMLSGIVTTEQIFITIGNLSREPHVIDLAAEGIRMVREGLKPCELRDVQNNKLRGAILEVRHDLLSSLSELFRRIIRVKSIEEAHRIADEALCILNGSRIGR